MNRNAAGWFEIYVQDMDRAKKFYEGVLERKLERIDTPDSMKASEMEMWTFPMKPEHPGCGGALVKMKGVPSGGCGTLVYFSSVDCAIEEKRVVSLGGRIHRSKMSIGGYGFIVLANDPDGNLIGIHSMK